MSVQSNKNAKTQGWVHRVFWISLLIKWIAGVLETVGGIILYFADNNTLVRVILLLTQHEPQSIQSDSVTSFLVNYASN